MPADRLDLSKFQFVAVASAKHTRQDSATNTEDRQLSKAPSSDIDCSQVNACGSLPAPKETNKATMYPVDAAARLKYKTPTGKVCYVQLAVFSRPGIS